MTFIEIISDIHRRMLLRLNDKFDKSTGSWGYDILKPVSIEINNVNTKLDDLNRKRDINNLVGDEVDIFVGQFSPIKRKKATYAEGRVFITGTPNLTVTDSFIVSSVAHDYKTIGGITLDETGNGFVNVQCLDAGVVGNAEIGAINRFPETIQGLETVTNTEVITGGYEQENDDTLRNRYFEYLQLPATSGNAHHYISWAKEVVGVGEAKVESLWNGNGTVKIIIVNSEGDIADSGLINQVSEYIDEVKPIGADTTVESAVYKNIDVDVLIKIASGYELGNIIDDLNNSLKSYKQSVAFKDSYVSYSDVANIIFNTRGVVEYSDLTLNGGIAHIDLLDNEIPSFSLVVGVLESGN